MGEKSKIVVSGDPTQTDLPKPTRSGLNDALARLRDIKGVSIIHLHRSDIVRHRLVQEIVDAYEDKPRHRPAAPPERTAASQEAASPAAAAPAESPQFTDMEPPPGPESHVAR
jgi:phosphate starvation-inducible PhoH-like protein